MMLKGWSREKEAIEAIITKFNTAKHYGLHNEICTDSKYISNIYVDKSTTFRTRNTLR